MTAVVLELDESRDATIRVVFCELEKFESHFGSFSALIGQHMWVMMPIQPAHTCHRLCSTSTFHQKKSLEFTSPTFT
jgi:hypothetical protein